MKTLKKILISLTFTISLILLTFTTKAAWNGQVKPYKKVSTDMRAVWVATVGNLNIEPQYGVTEDAKNEWKANFIKILDDAEANNLNTIVFQVRPCNDAFYPSKYNPWSKYLAGFGVNPGWDPLKWMIEETHKRGLEYHAWLNPYRATTDKTTSMVEGGKIKDVDVDELNSYKDSYFGRLKEQAADVDNPALKQGNELYHNVVLGAEDLFVLNPASQNVRDHVTNTILEIVDNYDIDGIHFDDYFYPSTTSYYGSNTEYKKYTFSTEPWVDMADYKEYLKTTDTPLSIYDWRRENVNKLIKQISTALREKNKSKDVKCAFGISPAARWAPTVEACSSAKERGAEGGMSGSCYNYYSYSDLYADTLKWAKENWIDYITPQNYTNLKKDYDEIIKWWNDALEGSKTLLYVGTALYQCKDGWGNGLSEIYFQILYNSEYMKNVSGYFLFSYSSMIDSNGKKAMNPIVTAAWKYNALTPLYPSYEYEKKVEAATRPKDIKVEDNLVTIEYEKVDNAKGYGVYELKEDVENIKDNLIPSNLVALEINPNKPLEFKKQKGYVYYLVTYDQDNSIYEDVTLLELDNKLPTIDVELDKPIYTYGDEITIDVTINDEDSSEFYISVALSLQGVTTSNYLVKNEKITTKNYQIKTTAPSFSTTNGNIIVEVKDVTGTAKKIKSIAIKSKAPIVKIDQISNVERYTVITPKLTVDDDNDSSLKYNAYVSYDGGEYLLFLSESIRRGTIELFLNCDEIADNAIIKIEVIDVDQNVTTIYSNAFKVLDDSEPVEPTPTEPEPVEPIIPKEEKGCGCKKSALMVFSLITILLGTIIVIRKEQK